MVGIRASFVSIESEVIENGTTLNEEGEKSTRGSSKRSIETPRIEKHIANFGIISD